MGSIGILDEKEKGYISIGEFVKGAVRKLLEILNRN